MKVLFANPKSEFFMELPTNPLGLLSIATCLETHNHQVKLFENGISKGSFKKIIKDFSPDVVGISVISGKAVKDAMALSKTAKNVGIPVVWGGYLPSALPELTLKTGCVDIISIGEGEETWLDLLECFSSGGDIRTVKGLAFLNDGSLIKTPERAFVDLSCLPSPDFELIDIERYIYPYYYSQKTLSLYSSKGCTGHCTFCYNAGFHKSTHRIRPPEQVVGEMMYLSNKYGVDGFHLNDDLIFSNKEEVARFCAVLRKADLNIVWGSSSVIGALGRNDLQLMYDTGCRWLFFGIESGSKDMLKNIKKGIDYNKIEQTYDACAEIGIHARAGFIIGLPGENKAHLKESVALAQKLETSQISINYFAVIPGSEAYETMIFDGVIDRPNTLEEVVKNFRFDILRNYSEIPDKELRVVYSFFTLRNLITERKIGNTESAGIWSGAIVSGLRKILSQTSLRQTFSYINHFISIVFHALFFPKVLKEYGLNFVLLFRSPKKVQNEASKSSSVY